ncbi:glycoside hydrolase [Rodentibacter pneumotropicus]|uniref:lysozyme n=1 Tax=Rodentibacter pneumotropicus TaxID=758 RepID=UPI000988A34F|nr:lysozyme [Rodentibacter pneumotropicus]OOF68492.1 glycoside hydrolase [Rodentibacter pneumotropicus]THA07284.1 lysozyme [Rodentibacter pneumotropicus]
MKHKKKIIAACSISVIIGLLQLNHPDLRTSQAGMEIIGNAEGCRHDPYQCPSDVLTVGIGSTEASGEKINPNKRYTDKEIADRWANDLRIAERCVNQYGNGSHLPQGTFDAMTSIVFNVGCGAMRKSTMFRKANAGDYIGACNELPKWVYAGGKKLRGLEIRREKERALCLRDLKVR